MFAVNPHFKCVETAILMRRIQVLLVWAATFLLFFASRRTPTAHSAALPLVGDPVQSPFVSKVISLDISNCANGIFVSRTPCHPSRFLFPRKGFHSPFQCILGLAKCAHPKHCEQCAPYHNSIYQQCECNEICPLRTTPIFSFQRRRDSSRL